MTEPASPATPAAAPARRAARWGIFIGTAATVILLDQVSKALIAARLPVGEAMEVIGSLLVFVHGKNTGALFGLLGQSAPILAVISPFVIALIVYYQSRAGGSPLVAMALGLLLGGAIGNLIDRIRFGYVLDWIDAGIGDLRFWTFNVADAAISISIALLLLIALVPRLAELGVSAAPDASADA